MPPGFARRSTINGKTVTNDENNSGSILQELQVSSIVWWQGKAQALEFGAAAIRWSKANNMSQRPNPFSDNPYASPQVQGQPFLPPPGTLPFAPCPTCGNTFASKIGFTWWGGMVGPAMFTHVKCCRCGNAYNGKTGKSNNTAIAIYVAVSTVIGLILVVALIAMGAI